MPYDEKVAEILRKGFARCRGVEEKKMFGGIAFMYRKHMCAGVIDDVIVIRVGPGAYEAALSEPHAEVFDRQSVQRLVTGSHRPEQQSPLSLQLLPVFRQH